MLLLPLRVAVVHSDVGLSKWVRESGSDDELMQIRLSRDAALR